MGVDVSAIPCRPTISCNADIVAPGALEIEVGYIARRLPSVEGSPQAAGSTLGLGQGTFPVLFKLSLAKWIQLQVGSNGYTFLRGPVAAHYLDNVNVGFKLHLVDQGSVAPSVALSAAFGVPTFAGQTGYVREDNVFATAHVSKDLGPLHEDLNVGVIDWGIDGSARAQPFVALATSTALPSPFGVACEVYYFGDATPQATRDGGVLLAVTHTPRPWLVFDVGVDAGFFPSTRPWSAFVGMTVVPAVLWGVPSKT